MSNNQLLHAGCVHCNDFPSYICSECRALICKYCQNDHVCVKGNLEKCYSAKEGAKLSR